MRLRFGLFCFCWVLLTTIIPAQAVEKEQMTLFSGDLRVEIPKNWKHDTWVVDGLPTEQFSNGTSLSVAFIMEKKVIALAAYIDQRKSAVQAVWKELPDSKELSPRNGGRIVAYQTASGKRHRYLYVMPTATGFLTIDIMQTKPETYEADLITIQTIIDSVVRI